MLQELLVFALTKWKLCWLDFYHQNRSHNLPSSSFFLFCQRNSIRIELICLKCNCIWTIWTLPNKYINVKGNELLHLVNLNIFKLKLTQRQQKGRGSSWASPYLYLKSIYFQIIYSFIFMFNKTGSLVDIKLIEKLEVISLSILYRPLRWLNPYILLHKVTTL